MPSPRIPRAAVVLLLSALAVSGAALAGGPWPPPLPPAPGAPRSEIIYPPQRLPLTFSHVAHLARGAGCEACHPAATTSRSAVDLLLPTEAACRACHPIDRAAPDRVVAGAPPARCDACHPASTTPPPRVVIPTPALKFSHARHAERGIGCAACHGDLRAEGVTLATRAQLPAMATCLGCHDGVAAPDRCDTCHLAEAGVLRTAWAHGRLVPSGAVFDDGHGPGFERDHGRAAAAAPQRCEACHRRSECEDCHAGVARPLSIHPGDYALTHGVDARRDAGACDSCHREQSFCVGCHERAGVGARAGGGFRQADPAARFHPADWVDLAGGGNRHAAAARANLASCASCHREDECADCHGGAADGPRLDPHGPGWRGSARCEAQLARNPRVCSRCHVEAERLDCGWSAR